MVTSHTLEEYRAMVDVETCLCGADLPDTVDAYAHHGGWPVTGLRYRVWLYITCTKCGSQLALWKLGVPRPETDLVT